ncbi:hypothetical protein VJI72_07865, partial [Parvimonas micra]
RCAKAVVIDGRNMKPTLTPEMGMCVSNLVAQSARLLKNSSLILGMPNSVGGKNMHISWKRKATNVLYALVTFPRRVKLIWIIVTLRVRLEVGCVLGVIVVLDFSETVLNLWQRLLNMSKNSGFGPECINHV